MLNGEGILGHLFAVFIVITVLAAGCVVSDRAQPIPATTPISVPTTTPIPIPISTSTPTPTTLLQHQPGYWIIIDPIGNHSISKPLILTGTTNLNANSILRIWVYEQVFICPRGAECYGWDGVYDNVSVTAGDDGINRWSFRVNLTGALPNNCAGNCLGYLVDIRSVNETTWAKNYTNFNLIP